MRKKKISFIVNPISGVGKQKSIEKLTKIHIDKNLFDYEILYTNAPKHATELARNAAANNADIVAVVGGDGSVNEVGKGLLHSGTTMAIVPAGSGNGLARHLKIPINLKKAIQLINSGNETIIDSGSINGESFFNVAGVGFDAQIVYEFSQDGNRGFWTYFKLIAKAFSTFKERKFDISIDGKEYLKSGFLVTLANGSQWGNNAFVSPDADIADGLIDVAIMKHITPLNVLIATYKVFTKTAHKSSYIEIIRGKDVTIMQSDETAQIDGEPLKSGNNITLKMDPLSLKVIVP